MPDEHRTKLLFGPYDAPAVAVGDLVHCLYRDEEVAIVDWSLARIPWPLCRRLGPDSGRGSLLVNEELARAVCHESAAAITHWWGVCATCVMRWRKALGVGRKNNPGSQRLIRAAAELASAQGHVPLTEEQIEERRWRRVRKNTEANDLAIYRKAVWSDEEMSLLGTMPDADVAAKLGRTHEGVQLKRERLGIACYRNLAVRAGA